jgi:hypothetical protein
MNRKAAHGVLALAPAFVLASSPLAPSVYSEGPDCFFAAWSQEINHDVISTLLKNFLMTSYRAVSGSQWVLFQKMVCCIQQEVTKKMATGNRGRLDEIRLD